MLCIIDPVGFVPEIAGKHDPAQLFDNIDNAVLIGADQALDLVNITTAAVVLQNGVYHAFDPLLKLHIPHLLFSAFISYTGRIVNVPIDTKVLRQL